MIQQRKSPRHQVADALRARVLAGDYTPGGLLPSTRELAAEYRCAINTAHEALRLLATEGLIVVRPRRGATVAWPEHSVAGPNERLARSTEGALFRPMETVEMLRVQLVTDAPPDAAEAFGLPEDAALGLREYLVRTADAIVTYGASYIHPDVWAAVDELQHREQIPDGIIGAIRRATGRTVAGVPTRRKADWATPEEAHHLGVAEDSPVLVEITECVADDGGTLEWNISIHPARFWVGA